jgi:2-hydroxychromene-2-carboxylate isomerase
MTLKKTKAAWADHIDLSDPASIQRWCEHFGITEQQLDEAIKAVGPEPAAVREHLLNQGASAGVG